MATQNLVPRVSGEGSLGRSVKPWASGYFDSVYVGGTLYQKGAAVASNLVDGYIIDQNLRQADDIVFASGDFSNGLRVNGVDVATGALSALEVQDEAVSLSTATTKINFAGAGVTATEPSSDEILVTIPGGGGGSADSATEAFVMFTR